MNYINNWIVQLTGALAANAAALPVPAPALERLALGAGVVYALTITESLNPLEQDAFEIIHVVGTGPGEYTLLRGREGTDGASWPAGAYVYCSITAGTLTSLQQQMAALDARIAALESGGGELPEGALVDSAGNALVDEQGNYLTYGE